MSPTRGLGANNPLAQLDRPGRRMPSVIPTAATAVEPDAAAEPAPRAAPAAREPKVNRKRVKEGQTQLTVYVDEEVAEEARDAIMYLANQPEGPVNLSDLVNQALHREIAHLRTSYHQDAPFPPRRRQLRPGRPT